MYLAAAEMLTGAKAICNTLMSVEKICSSVAVTKTIVSWVSMKTMVNIRDFNEVYFSVYAMVGLQFYTYTLTMRKII